MNEYFQKIITYITNFMQSDYMNIVSFVLAIISIALAYVFYRKSKKRLQLGYRRYKYTVLDDNSKAFKGLSISYENEPLYSFSITEFVISNLGNVSINKSDIAPSNPIIIHPPEGKKILDHTIVFESNKDNNISIRTIEDNKVCIEFDFLNPEDKFSVRLIHTGNAEDNLPVTGTIIGEVTPFSEQSSGTRLISGQQRIMLGLMKFSISPKFKWARITLDYTFGIASLAYALLGVPGKIIMIVCILFGAMCLFTGTKRIFKKGNNNIFDQKDRIEHMIDSQVQGFLKTMKSSVIDDIPPNKANSADAKSSAAD